MPWRCPVCQTDIQHNEEQPTHVAMRYRCHVCRTELILEATTERLLAAPVPRDDDGGEPRRS
jgi:hypothetical protein